MYILNTREEYEKLSHQLRGVLFSNADGCSEFAKYLKVIGKPFSNIEFRKCLPGRVCHTVGPLFANMFVNMLHTV